jgi:hypothetical protein
MPTQIPLVEKIRQSDRYITLVRDGKGGTTEGIELTQKEYDALAFKGAGAPPGVSEEDWESGKVFAVGGVPDYGNKQKILEVGEYVELSDRFELGIVRKGFKETLRIMKSKVDFSKVAGLTITKVQQDAWPDYSGIESIVNGILTLKD